MNQEQNLINSKTVSLPSSITGKPAGFYTSIILDVLSILSAAYMGYTYRAFLSDGGSIWYIILSFMIFGVFSGLQALLCKEVGRRIVIILAEIISISLFFYVIDWRFLLGGFLTLFIFYFLGYSGSRSEVEYGIDIRPFKMTRAVIGRVLTGTIIFMILIYIPLWNQNGVFISEKSFDAFFNWSSGVVKVFYPDFSTSGSVGDLTNSIAKSQLSNVASFKYLTPQAQDTLVQQGSASIITSIEKSIGLNFQASDTLSSVVYHFIVKTLTDWENSLQGTFYIGWSVVVFFVIRSIGVVLIWFDQLLLVAFYEVMLALNLIHIKQEQRTKEIIGY